MARKRNHVAKVKQICVQHNTLHSGYAIPEVALPYSREPWLCRIMLSDCFKCGEKPKIVALPKVGWCRRPTPDLGCLSGTQQDFAPLFARVHLENSSENMSEYILP